MKKSFEIFQLYENISNEFVVVETFYILGISIWYTYHGVDGKKGDLPFTMLSSAEKVKKELEIKESKDKLQRNNILYWGLFILFLIVLKAKF